MEYLSSCTEITPGGIRTAAGAEINGSLYHYGTMTDSSYIIIVQ